MANPLVQDDWKSTEKRQLVVRKIAESIQQYPDVLNRNPAEIEEAIFSKSHDKDSYMNTVGKVLLSIKNKHQQQRNMAAASAGHMGHMNVGGAGMMGGHYQPGMDPNFHNMHMRPMHHGMPVMGPGMPSHPHMMNQSGYGRVGGGMMPGGGVIPPGHPHSHHPGAGPMMGMGPRNGVPHNIMYPTRGVPMNAPATGLVHRVPNAPPQSDGMQPVTALPNPSFHGQMPGTNTDQLQHNVQPSASSTTNLNSQQTNSIQQPSYQTGMGGAPQQPPPTGVAHQAPSPAPPKPTYPSQAPSPRQVPMPSPSTPWNPNSPAHAPSPGQPQPHPEANSAVLNKLQELQPYVPLLARMMDKIPGDKTKNEQWVKLNSLYNVIQSKNIKVPLQTLEKCHTALEGLFNKKDSSSSSVPSPAPKPSTTGGDSVSSDKTLNPSSVPPKAVPSSPSVVSAPTRNLHEFVSLGSPRPLSSRLQPTYCPNENPLDRLPPEKKIKLENQANQSFRLGLKREIMRLKNFQVKEIQEEGKGTDPISLVTLKCNLVSSDLPTVPPIIIRITRDYPNTSPECLMPEYQTDSSTEFEKKVGQLLLNQLSRCELQYSISHVLYTWERSVLEMVTRELGDLSE